MVKWTIKEMVEFAILGFDNERNGKIETLKPLEDVTSIEYPIDSDKIILHSDTRQFKISKNFFEPVRVAFKGADMYLSKEMVSKIDEETKAHVLIFDLGRGYFALLMGIKKE